MNTTTKTQLRFVGAAFVAIAALLASSCEASLIRMGLNKDKMPVDKNDVLHTFERARRLQFLEMRELQDNGAVPTDAIIDVETVEGESSEDDHSQNVVEFVAMQEDVVSNVTDLALDLNETDDSSFFAVTDDAEAVDGDDAIEELIAVQGRTDGGVVSGPRGGRADAAPHLQPTEISFMILMEDFRYSAGIDTVDDIKIGTKFGFTGKIATRAEDLGVASGSCTVTSDIKKELSYCDIYHKIDTDNFGGFGSVMVAGTADEVGGRLLVTGTGGSLQSTRKGYAMVQFDPAGNPVLYVLLKLF